MAAPVMTMAGIDMSAPDSSGTTVAGVRAVATVIIAPLRVRLDMMCDDFGLTLLSAFSSVPSMSLTYKVFILSVVIFCSGISSPFQPRC